MGMSVSSTTRIPVYNVADAAALSALTSMQNGDLCLQDDTGIWYFYNGSSWVSVSSSLIPALDVIGTYSLTNDPLFSHDAVKSSTGGTLYAKAKEWTIGANLPINTTIRIQYKIGSTNASFDGYGWIRRNGSQVGIEGSFHGTNYGTETQDLEFSAGDTCELWIKTNNGSFDARCKDFRLLGAPTLPTTTKELSATNTF